MVEEKTQEPVEPKVEEKPAEPVITEKKIEEVSKEVEVADNAKLDALKTELQEKYNKQAEEQAKALEEASKKIEEMSKQVEEMKGRKGLAEDAPVENPYTKPAEPEPSLPKVEEKLDPYSINEFSKQEDVEAGQAFLDSLKNK